MNKTLLLIICDFLLLNLLALTRFEKVEPVEKRKAPVPAIAANSAKSATDDLVESMRIALADEQAAREKLSQQLSADVKQREAALTELQQQRQQLEANLQQSQKAIQETGQKLQAVAQQAAAAQEKLQHSENQQKTLADTVRSAEQEKKQLLETLRMQQLENERRQAELEKQRQIAAAIEKEKRDAEKQVASLNTAVKVAETEKAQLQKNVVDLKQEVTSVRQEKAKLQEQTTALATGVNQLAAKSGELTREVREIRESTPINANILFNDFLSNRVQVTVSGVAPGVFSPNPKHKNSPTILIADAGRIHTLVHIYETPLVLANPVIGVDRPSVKVVADGAELRHGNLFSSTIDPRILAVPIERVSADALGLKVFPLAKNPFKFTEAVLVSRSGKYGEVEFRLDPKLPEFVKMKNKVLSRIFGEFSPNAGDLVFSKTGEILGMMVNDDYCAIIKVISPRAGFEFDPSLARDAVVSRLTGLYDIVERLPQALR